jgi:hypothetical protein
VTVAGFYDDNIFASEKNDVGSYVAFVGPQVVAETERGNLSIRGFLGGGFTFYERDSKQNTEEADANLRGRYRFSPSDSASTQLRFRRTVVSRDDEDLGGGAGDPRMLHRIIGRVGYSADFGAFSMNVRAQGADRDFQNSIQRDKDNIQYDGAVRVGYRATRFLTPFINPISSCGITIQMSTATVSIATLTALVDGSVLSMN